MAAAYSPRRLRYLIAQGKLPKPDIAVMADTEREKSTTWAYLEAYTRPLLASVGVDLVVICKSDYGAPDLVAYGDTILLPMYTTHSGDGGRLQQYCSDKWKARTVHRYLRSVGVKQCDMWFGMSIDEQRRLRPSTLKWIRNLYPLMDLRLNRAGCVAVVRGMGWPDPPRSACWMCPHQGDREWREMGPEDFTKAVELEQEMQVLDPAVWLHKSCRPLDQVQFEDRDALFTGCASGMCFV